MNNNTYAAYNPPPHQQQNYGAGYTDQNQMLNPQGGYNQMNPWYNYGGGNQIQNQNNYSMMNTTSGPDNYSMDNTSAFMNNSTMDNQNDNQNVVWHQQHVYGQDQYSHEMNMTTSNYNYVAAADGQSGDVSPFPDERLFNYHMSDSSNPNQ